MKPFVAALGEELDLTSEEIAEILWLAVQMGELPQPEQIAIAKKAGSRKSSSSKTTSEPPLETEEESDRDTTEPTPPAAEIHLEDRSANLGGGLTIALPDARSLREPLTLARSLKPLLQKMASGWSNTLDEVATIDRIVTENLWLPSFKPSLEPWLDLVLVVDESLSMQIWQRTISELQRFLAAYGVFRDVRVYSLVVEGEQAYVRPCLGKAGRMQTLRNPQELIDPSGRRLILVATDCVSSLWRTGELLSPLQLFAQTSPMAIVQMLPEWLWNRSGLELASKVRFSSLDAGLPNARLTATNISFWDDLDLDLGIKVPVVTLEPEPMKIWAQLVAGKGGVQSPGVVFDPEPLPTADWLESKTGERSGMERARQFQATASPMARQLAMILAAAPAINLPIVRILQDRLLPKSQQVHVAEVFLGGLLKPLVEVDGLTNPDTVPYEFMDGARDVLLNSVGTTEILRVMEAVSQFVAERLGLGLEAFMGVLKNPQMTEDRELVGKSRPFALVTAQILRKLGGGYDRSAQELERAYSSYKDYSEIIFSASGKEIALEMIAIESGSFTMGSPEDEIDRHTPRRSQHRSRESPQHNVTLQSFYLSRYPITQSQWETVANNYEKIDLELNPNPAYFKGKNHPVHCVNWYEANEFCKRLSIWTGKNYCLPSESQWEYACRAESKSAYYDGAASCTLESLLQGTSQVGLLPANNWGLEDLNGNVWQWCEDDWHSDYTNAPNDGSAWIDDDIEGSKKVIRGAAWDQHPRTRPGRCRSAYRAFFYIDGVSCNDARYYEIHMRTIGLRVCCIP
jgi:formylglycine-generating enzyme required for sulfatase activity